jgi:glucose/arabinose dehydrogenase
MAFLGGKLWFAGLRGQTLYALPVDDLRPETLERHLAGEYGRLRTVVLGPDGLLYITTSNGNGANAVDRVLRVNPALLGED